MSNNHELRRTFNCCDKKRREGMGYDKNTVDDSVAEQYKFYIVSSYFIFYKQVKPDV